MSEITAWHFAGETLRDGTPLPRAGETLPEISDPVPCKRGYHGSVRALDALKYAPGPYVARVRLHGHDVVPHEKPVDKYTASLRTGITDYVNATREMRAFARWCALDVAHLWDMPDVVRRYLETGDEEIRDAARDAARDAVWNAARAAAWDVARDAVWDAARGAARAATWDVARDAVWNAARAAAWDVARDAVWDAARGATLDRYNTELERRLINLLEREA